MRSTSRIHLPHETHFALIDADLDKFEEEQANLEKTLERIQNGQRTTQRWVITLSASLLSTTAVLLVNLLH